MTMSQYVITSQDGETLLDIFPDGPPLTVIKQLDDYSALVEIRDEQKERFCKEYPELIVEPNIGYKHQ